MTQFEYSLEKDAKLRQERLISFEELIALILDGFLIDVLDHPNQVDYPGQKIYLIDVDDYVWLVPYIQTEETIFLKTAFPSRKHTKIYMDEKYGKSRH